MTVSDQQSQLTGELAMPIKRRVQFASFATVLLVAAAISTLIRSSSLPAWLLTAELGLLSFAALAYAFTGGKIRLPAWAWSRPFRGVVAMALGLLVVYVPLQFIMSAYLMGSGARMLWLSASEGAAAVPDSALARRPGVDLVERPNGQMARMP